MTTAVTRRVPTGVAGFDVLIEGGLLAGGVYIIKGPPGSGKTILANQMSCYHAGDGGRVAYFTLLAESHARMITHLRRMRFFRPELVGDGLVYYSGYRVLEEEGLPGLVKLLRRSAIERGVTLLIVDGIATAGASSESTRDFKKFVHELQTLSTSLGCTTILLSSPEQSHPSPPEHTIVDGLIELSDDLNGLRALRHLEVPKMRGTRQVRGLHTVEITDDGIVVHPRFEAGVRETHRRIPGPPRRGFGIGELDEMLQGGVPNGSITMVIGASGVGKTTLQLQFLSEGGKRGEKGLYCGFYEPPDALLAKCKRIHLGIQPSVDAGVVQLMWERPIEGVLDVIADRLMRRVRETGSTRLCIDGLHTLFRTVDFPERMRAVTAALAEQLEGLGVTTVFSVETPELVGAPDGGIQVPIDDLSALTHNVIAIRYVEREAHLDRLLSIIKMRDSNYDRGIRELQITEHGIVLSKLAHSSQQPESSRSGNGNGNKPMKGRHR
ncbi:MAG: kaiC 2 [Myxococcales bacterium]|nr:kaiC 2 [Myxococcales bacterium]